MKRRLFAIALMAAMCSGYVSAADESSEASVAGVGIIGIIEAPGNIAIVYPPALLNRLQPPVQEETEEPTHAAATTIQAATKVGYRIQVFDDNNPSSAKHDAQVRSQQMQARFPEWRTYIQFNSPYWRVKVGDFKTRSEAEAAMSSIRSAFPAISPSLRVVRDRINHQ